MNVRAVDIGGVMNNNSEAVVSQIRTSDAAQSSSTRGGNGDVSTKQVKRMVEDMQSQLDSMNISLQYSLYGDNGRNIAVKVVNKETGDVIREIPPKEIQVLQEKMSELVGMIFNKSV